jgi:hypothetical protein
MKAMGHVPHADADQIEAAMPRSTTTARRRLDDQQNRVETP